MSELLPPVVAKLDSDISGFKRGMDDARGQMDGVAKSGSSSFGALAVGVGAAAAGIGVAVIGIGAASISAFSTAAGEVAKLQRLTGGTAEDMSKMRFQAQQTGVSYETLSKGVIKMSKAAEANSAAFAEHGIATRDAAGNLLGMNDIMANAADVFAGMPNGVEKTAIAVQLFGRSGADMIPMLNQGRDGLMALGEEADKYGQIISEDGVDAMKANKAAQRDMSAAMEGMKIQIGQYLMPVMAKFATFMAENIPVAVAAVKKVMEFLAPTIDVVSEAFTRISTFVAEHWPEVQAVIEQVVAAIGAAFDLLVQWTTDHWTQIQAVVQFAIDYVRTYIEAEIAVITYIWDRFGSNIINILTSAWTYIQHTVENVMQIIRGIIEVVTGLIHGDWGKVWQGIQDIFGGVWNQIVTYLHLALDMMRNALGIAWTAIGDAIGLAWEGFKNAIIWAIQSWVDLLLSFPQKAVTALNGLGALMVEAARVGFGMIWTGAQNAWDTGVSFLTNLPGNVVSALSSLSGKLRTVGYDMIKSMWDGIKAAWNWMADHTEMELPKMHIPGTNRDIGGGSFSLLPHLAGGGVLFGPTAFVGGEYAGASSNPEIVAPQSMIRDIFRKELARGSGSGMTQHNHFNGITDPAELARLSASEASWALRTAR